MKIPTTAPDLSTLEINAIKDLLSVEFHPENVRILQLTGIPVRIEVDQTYAELQSEIKDIKITNYDFSQLSKFFFKNGYLYGFVNNGNVFIYDVFTNGNFLSSKDLNYLKDNFNLPVVQPIAEGRFTTNEIISLLYKKKDSIDLNEVYAFPSVYIADGEEKKPSIHTSILYGKKTYGYYNYDDYDYDYNHSNYNYPAQTTCTLPKSNMEAKSTYNNVGSLLNEIKEEKEKKKEVFTLSTKEERTKIYNETLKNVNSYYLLNKKELPKGILEWYKKKGKFFAWLYAIHTLPATREIVYDYLFTQELEYENWYDYNQTDKSTFWGWIFLDFFEYEYKDSLKNAHKEIEDEDYSYFTSLFREELNVFDGFFNRENAVTQEIEIV